MKKRLAIILWILISLTLISCQDDKIGALPHTHNHVETYVTGNCSSYGITTYHCYCGDTYEVLDEEYGDHVYSLEYTIDQEPTLTQEGLKSRHCLYCESRFDETVIPCEKPDLPLINP